MMLPGRVTIVMIGLVCAAATALFAADPPREIHGSGDAYAGEGVALAWAVLRGADETATQIVVRIVADQERYPLVAAAGRNPFSQKTKSLLGAIRSAGDVELHVARASFSDFPRTEFRFYASPEAAKADEPRLAVYFLGVPDTTPEFTSEAKLAAYLDDRIARLRASRGRSP